MGDWTIYVNNEPLQSDLSEQAAGDLVQWHTSHDEPGVYALGPDGQRIPKE